MNEDEPRRRPQNDIHRDDSPAGPKRQMVDDLVMGIRFYSRLPVGDRPHEKPDLTRIALALPFASLAIAVLPALLLLGASLLGLPRLFVGGLAVTAAIIVGGAMAEAAIAAAAAGLFGGTPRERRLEIMRDSRHGTYGVAGLCMFLLLRVAALAALAEIDAVSASLLWIAAMVMARSGALWLTVALPSARPDGASASVGRVGMSAILMGAVFALILGLILAGPSAGLGGFLFAVALAAAVIWGWTDLCRRFVGGQTGDLIGALQALLEVAMLGAFLLFV